MTVEKLADRCKAALERINILVRGKKFIVYRTNGILGEEPVAEVRAHSLGRAVAVLKKKQKEGGISQMWTVFENKRDRVVIRGVVMTVVTHRGMIIQNFMQ